MNEIRGQSSRRGAHLGACAVVLVLALAACGGPAAQPSPTPAATPTPAAATPTPAAAVTKGTIVKVSGEGREIVVKTADGKEVRFDISASRTTIAGSITSRSAFKVGQEVTVEGPPDGEAKKVTVK